MTDAGLWISRRQRPPKIYQLRARRACLEQPIQIDGSKHAWFENRASVCTLRVYVDDATSQLMALHHATESTFSYFKATRVHRMARQADGVLQRQGERVSAHEQGRSGHDALWPGHVRAQHLAIASSPGEKARTNAALTMGGPQRLGVQ